MSSRKRVRSRSRSSSRSSLEKRVRLLESLLSPEFLQSENISLAEEGTTAKALVSSPSLLQGVIARKPSLKP